MRVLIIEDETYNFESLETQIAQTLPFGRY